MRSDDAYWDLSLGGTTKLDPAWGKANLLVGEDDSDKIVAGYLASSTNGAVIGAHNSALTDWAPLNVSGTYVNIRRNEITVAKFLDGCLSLFPLNGNYREGIRIHSYGSWSDILLCGDDMTGDTGTSANSWFIGNNNGNFYLTRNGSTSSTQAMLSCGANYWFIKPKLGVNGNNINYNFYVDGNTRFDGQAVFSGETSNGKSIYQFNGATYRNPNDHTPEVLISSSNAMTGIDGYRPGLVLYNPQGNLNATVGLTFAFRETATSGNSVMGAAILAVKESEGTVDSWSQSGLQFLTKNMGTKIEAMRITNAGNVYVKNGFLWIQGGSEAGSDLNRLTTTSGMPGNMQYNQSRRGTQIYANGIAFCDPYNGNNNNDSGWIRQVETSANSGYLEMAVGDDGNESIYVRQYSTSNNIVTSLTLLDANHNTTIPNALTVGTTESQGNNYNFYVNGTSYFNGNTTHNGIDYFANGTTYYINNSAQASLNNVSIGGVNFGYKLYVNGTSYFNGNVTHNGITYFANGTTYSINNSADATLRRGNFRGTSDSNTAASDYYHTGALEIRESNYVGNGQSAFAYAPRIGFHWANRIAASLSFHSDGIFYLRTQNGVDRASLDANLIGNAATATAVKDRQTGTITYLNYGASGLTSASWLAAWNGYELRAISLKTVQDLVQHSRQVTVDLSSLDNSKWFPVTGTSLPSFGYNKIKVSVQLNSGTVPSWSTHASGFTCNMELYVTAAGWGTTGGETIVLASSYSFASIDPCGFQQQSYNSMPVLWLRGGGKYFVETDFDCTWTVRTSSYDTYNSGGYVQTVTPTTTHPGIQGINGTIKAGKVYGAVWNDYAEYRSTSAINPGQCVVETGLGDLVQSTKRLQPGANIVSDTFGFAIGETEKTKTPLAVSGRVLAYPYEDRYSYSAGDPVCSGPNGTISKMTREEVCKYPDRIVGTVSEIPEYETWGTGNVKVDGRIWIKVR